MNKIASILIFIASLVLSGVAQAQESCQGGSHKGTSNILILFVNGISNSPEDACSSSQKLRQLIGQEYLLNFDYLYNPKDGLTDKQELAWQAHESKATLDAFGYTSQEVLSDDRKKENYYSYLGGRYRYNEANNIQAPGTIRITTKRLRQLIVDLVSGSNYKRVILVPHSQGNFYVEAAYADALSSALADNDLELVRRLKDYIRVVGVASVAASTPNNQYLTHELDDAVLTWQPILSVFGQRPLPHNVVACGTPCWTNSDTSRTSLWLAGADLNLHNFQATYLNPNLFSRAEYEKTLPSIIKSKIQAMIDYHLAAEYPRPVAQVALSDDFNGNSIDAAKWTSDGWNATIGPVSISDGYAQFGVYGRISTKGKIRISGEKIVVEGRMAGQGASRDTSVYLVDELTGHVIYSGDTSYCGWGFYAHGGSQSYAFLDPAPLSCTSSPVNGIALGGSTNQFMEYRWTLEGNKIKVERGPSLGNITQSASQTLGLSIVGRSFYLSIGSASSSLSPGTFDWIRVNSSPAVAGQSTTSGSITILANTIPGATLIVPAGASSCSFNSTGTWSAGPNAPPQYQNADGVIGGTSYNLTNFGVPMPGEGNMALVVKQSSTSQYVLLGSSKTIGVSSGETLTFMMNDATTFGYTDGNTGQLSTAWSCH